MEDKKDTSLKICCICGEVILNDDYDYSKTKRGNNIYWHRKCHEIERRYLNEK